VKIKITDLVATIAGIGRSRQMLDRLRECTGPDTEDRELVETADAGLLELVVRLHAAEARLSLAADDHAPPEGGSS
jgi:hypothetical protein